MMIKCEDEHPYCKPPPLAEGPEEELASSTDMQQQPVIMEWSENFQDLSLFCNFGSKMAVDNQNMMLRSGEQLDTPIITVNDEFDFGQRGSSRVSQQQHQLLLADASLDDTDPWADLQQQQQQPPPSNNDPLPTAASNVKQWESVTDWLCSSSSQTIGVYEPPSTVANSTFDENFDDSTKLGHDFLIGDPTLKMEHDEKGPQRPESTNLQEDLNPVLNKEQTIDIVELLKSANSCGEPIKSTNNRLQYIVASNKVTDNSNSSRMQYSFAGKVVDSSDQTQYSAESKVADASNSSRMQYSLAGNKVADINNSSTMQYSVAGSRNRVVTVPNTSMEHVNKVTDPSNRLEYQFVGNSNKARDTISSNNSRKVLRNSLLLKNSSSSSNNKNNRDPLIGDSLSSIFKAEEPLVQATAPLLLGAKNLKKPQLVLHTSIPPKLAGKVIEIGSASPSDRSEMIFGEEFVLPDIKAEPEEELEEKEEEREEQPAVRLFQAPQKQVKKLKLDIRSANTLAAGAVGLTPSTAVLAESLDTPDVLKPLLEGMDNPSFDLIKYCEADELAGIPSPLVVESRNTIVPSAPKIAPPTYGEKKEENYERREPLSTIKEEDFTTDESSSFQVARNSKNLPRKKITLTRKRRRTNFENYESENSSDTYVDNEDEDETFHLPPKTKYIQANRSKRQRLSSKTISIVASSPSKRKVSSSGIDSDQESIMSQDRYRELRDRNNEASKRSRMNRKSREMEMKEKADEMEQRNCYLKARAKRLDELVLTFREAIFKLIPKRS